MTESCESVGKMLNKKEIQDTLKNVTNSLINEYEKTVNDLKNKNSLFYKKVANNITLLGQQDSKLYLGVKHHFLNNNNYDSHLLGNLITKIADGSPLIKSDYITTILIPNYELVIQMLRENLSLGTNFVISDECSTSYGRLEYFNRSTFDAGKRSVSGSLLLTSEDIEGFIEVSVEGRQDKNKLTQVLFHELRHLFEDKEYYNFLMIASQKKGPALDRFPFYEIYPRIKGFKDYLQENYKVFFTLNNEKKEEFLKNLMKDILNSNYIGMNDKRWTHEIYIIAKGYRDNVSGLIILLEGLAQNETRQKLETLYSKIESNNRMT